MSKCNAISSVQSKGMAGHPIKNDHVLTAGDCPEKLQELLCTSRFSIGEAVLCHIANFLC